MINRSVSESVCLALASRKNKTHEIGFLLQLTEPVCILINTKNNKYLQTPSIFLFLVGFHASFHTVAQPANNSCKFGSLEREFGSMQTILVNALIKYYLNLCIHRFVFILKCIHLFFWSSILGDRKHQLGDEGKEKDACPNWSALLWTCPEWVRLGISITRWLAGERSGVIISRDWRWPLVVPVITSQRVVLAFPLLFPHCTPGSEFQSAPDLQSPRF